MFNDVDKNRVSILVTGHKGYTAAVLLGSLFAGAYIVDNEVFDRLMLLVLASLILLWRLPRHNLNSESLAYYYAIRRWRRQLKKNSSRHNRQGHAGAACAGSAYYRRQSVVYPTAAADRFGLAVRCSAASARSDSRHSGAVPHLERHPAGKARLPLRRPRRGRLRRGRRLG
ncbi:hypothetical protein IJ21_08930 [Paenibacillus sp. 32O-W]|nr:hypothetical protein IJ21_08930 [Paenibacillus sp. 32O-W]